jgi:hypothetical protein
VEVRWRPPVSVAVVTHLVSHPPRRYAYSAKGFYAYDWGERGGPYRRVSCPTVPVSIERIPGQLQAVARLAVFPVDFADEPEITLGCLVTG